MVWLDAQTQQCHVFSARCLVKTHQAWEEEEKMYLKEKN